MGLDDLMIVCSDLYGDVGNTVPSGLRCIFSTLGVLALVYDTTRQFDTELPAMLVENQT
jgi:hypothetical protein